MEEVSQVTKGGICWFEIAFSRGHDGLEIAVKALPQLESFMKSLGNDSSNLALYGKNWYPIGAKEINIWGMHKDFINLSYTLSKIAEPLEAPKDGRVNLSFLRMVGISEPQGVKFGVSGAFSKQAIKELSTRIVTCTSALIKDYIVPVHINLRISSQEI